MSNAMIFWFLLLLYPVGIQPVEKVRYLRPAGDKFVTECEFTQQRSDQGSTIESWTYRGSTKMFVSAKYNKQDILTTAQALLTVGEQKKTAAVQVADGKAKIEQAGQPAQVFEVPAGVIVTSAPDWTDTFLLCQRYDRRRGGKQSFPGLWIHPEQACQRLTFSIERHDTNTIEHAGKQLKLDRYTIWLRGNSSYAAWADAQGKMIKLIPLPYKEKANNWLVAEGYEKSARALRPQIAVP